MSILKKVSSIIPGKDDDKEYYLALLITYRGVETAVFYLDGNHIKSQTFGNAAFVGAGNILETAAEAIDQACEPLDTEVKDVILGLPDSWISNNQILPQYFDKLKELAKSLDIVPFAFVSHNHAMVNRLKIKFGTTICGFLLHIDEENLTLSSIKSGHLVQTRFLRSDSDDVTQGIQKLFAHFTLANQDCEYVYVVGRNIPANIDEVIQGLSLFSLQKPKVSRLDATFPVRSIALAGAVDRGNLLGISVEDEDTDEATNAQIGVTEDVEPKPVEAASTSPLTRPETTEEAAPIPTEESHENKAALLAEHAEVPVPPAAPVPEGFVVNQDIAQTKIDEPAEQPHEEHTASAPKASEPAPSTAQTPPEQHAFAVAMPKSDNLELPKEAHAHDIKPGATATPPVIHPGLPASIMPKEPAPETHDFAKPHRRLPLSGLGSLPTVLFNRLRGITGLFSGVTGRLGKLVFLLATPLIVLLLAIGVFFFLTKATVAVTFLPKTLESTLSVTVNPKLTSADQSTRQIPGTTLSTDVNGELKGNATGKKKVGEKAQGSVTIFNKTTSAKTFPKNTVITTNNLSFVLQDAATVPQRTSTESAEREIVIKPGKATVNVAADDIGESYNVANGTNFLIKGVPQDTFDAQANTAFTGGTSRDVTVIADDDLKRTEAQLTTQLKGQAKSALLSKITENQKIIDDSITITIAKSTTSKKAGDEATDFTMQASASAKATVYANDALKSLVDAAVKGQVPEGYNLSDNGVSGDATVKRVDKDGNVAVDWHYKATLVPKVDQEQLKKDLAGRSFDFATKKLQGIPNVSEVVITVQPQPFAVVKRLPFNASKITLTTNTAQ